MAPNAAALLTVALVLAPAIARAGHSHPTATVTVPRPAATLARAQAFLTPDHPRPGGGPPAPLASLLDRLLHAPGAVATSSPAYILLARGESPVVELTTGRDEAADAALAGAAAAMP